MEDLLHIGVKQQIKWKGTTKRSSNNNKTSNWRDKIMKDKGIHLSLTTSSHGESNNSYNNLPPK